MTMAPPTSGKAGLAGSTPTVVDEVFLAPIAGRRTMAVIGEDHDAAAFLAQEVGFRMDAAGAVVVVATSLPGKTLQGLLERMAVGKRRLPATRDAPVTHDNWALEILQDEDVALLTVLHAHRLDIGVLESLLLLPRIETEDGRFLQVLLAGNAGLAVLLDRLERAAAGHPLGVSRWLLAGSAAASAYLALPDPGHAATAADQPAPASQPWPAADIPSGQPAPGRRVFPRFWTAVILFLATAGTMPSVIRHVPPVGKTVAIEDPIPPAGEAVAIERSIPPVALPIEPGVMIEKDPVATAELTLTPAIFQAGETISVRAEIVSDAFVYCYYMDGFGQVARLFPNRFQPDAFIPAGQGLEIPPSGETTFNIRMDKGGRVEIVTCLASPQAIEQARIDGSETEDLVPVPGLELQQILDVFAVLSETGAHTITLPIAVVPGAEGWQRPGPQPPEREASTELFGPLAGSSTAMAEQKAVLPPRAGNRP